MKPQPQPLHHQRAHGALHLAFKRRGGGTALAGLRQEGCLKARFPRPETGAWTSAVTLNVSGGIAAGDALDVEIAAGERAASTVASQAAERYYRALPGAAPARVRTQLHVAPGAALEWLPQEAILFDGCALDRALRVDVAEDGWFLGVEAVVFGRAAMGERVRTARFRDLVQVRRAGRLVLHDAVRLDGDVQAALDRPAIGRGARAVATIIHAAPDAPARLDALRATLGVAPEGGGWEYGASAWDGLLLARIVAADGASQRAGIVAGLAALRAGRPLPRVWQC